MSEQKRKIILLLVILAIVALVVFVELNDPKNDGQNTNFVNLDPQQKQITKDTKYSRAIELNGSGGVINANDNLKIQSLIGKKVVLVDFWTYSCINCQRTLPYLNAWYDKYNSQGLEIIGVHTPEFSFEKQYNNVKAAVEKFAIKYPVVLDNNYGTWNAYKNRYWPHKFLIDIDGYIVYDHIGEGGYEETEKIIQNLLIEKQQKLKQTNNINTSISNPTSSQSVNFNNVKSPEIYFGAMRNSNLNNGSPYQVGKQSLTWNDNDKIKLNELNLDGQWNIDKEYASNESAKARIFFRYQANKVFMVAESDQELSLTIKRDGQIVKQAAGVDVDSNGVLKIRASQLYNLIQETDSNVEHTLEIIIDKSGLRVYTFTFG